MSTNTIDTLFSGFFFGFFFGGALCSGVLAAIAAREVRRRSADAK